MPIRKEYSSFNVSLGINVKVYLQDYKLLKSKKINKNFRYWNNKRILKRGNASKNGEVISAQLMNSVFFSFNKLEEIKPHKDVLLHNYKKCSDKIYCKHRNHLLTEKIANHLIIIEYRFRLRFLLEKNVKIG